MLDIKTIDMKTQRFLPVLATVILAGAMFLAGCEKEKKTSDDITNVKWHLTKFVDVENKTEEAPLYNSSDVFWLILKTSSFEGKSFSNVLAGTVNIDAVTNKITFSNIGGTEINELFDGQKFIDCLKQVYSFKITTENTLILYYDNNKKYLQFEKINN